MESHLSRNDLVHLLSAGGAQSEVDADVRHVFDCRHCRNLAADVAEELRDGAGLTSLPDKWNALLTLFDSAGEEALDQLRFEAWWSELRNMAPDRQRERIKSVLTLQTRRMFEVVLAEVTSIAASDPHVGEETALTARFVAELLPRCTEKRRNDLRGAAMTEVGNCRRLAADWSGSKAAFQEAGSFLERGTGDLKRRGRLLSVSASLASDTGHFEAAFRYVRQAAECYRKRRDHESLASVAVQEAGTLMASCCFEEALNRAKGALEDISVKPVKNPRLEILARDIITDCLIELKRPAQALRSFLDTRPIYEQFWGRWSQLRLDYMKARLLDAFGCAREAKKAFREAINGNIEDGLYKNAFLIVLTFLESLCKQGEWAKAASLCKEASGLLDTPFCHPQLKQVWDDLLGQVRSRAITAARLLELRLYVWRHWSVPAPHAPSGQSGSLAVIALATPLEPPEEPDAQQAPSPAPAVDLPPVPDQLGDGGYERAFDELDRRWITAALTKTGGSISETARLLRMARNTLKKKIKQLGLSASVTHARQPKMKTAGHRRRHSE